MQLELGITADVGTFSAEIKEDYAHARVFDDLRDGWIAYLETEMRGSARINSTKVSMSQRRELNKSPTPSEVEAVEAALASEAAVCLPSLLHQHW